MKKTVAGRGKAWGVALLLMVLGPAASAVERVVVMGLFEGMAIVKIDGQQRKLRLGEKSPEGVRLVTATSSGAELEVNGKVDYYRLGQDVHSNISAPKGRTVQVPRSEHGMYQSVGSINGQTVNFLIDTGASSVAMGVEQAARLGIDYRVVGTPMTVSTASGTARAWSLTLDKVKLGSIELHNVEGAVVEGPGPGNDILLGMSFLRRLKLKDSGQLLELTQTP